jgi:hypothetical protein
MLLFFGNSLTDALHYACQSTDWLNNSLYRQWVVHEGPVARPLYPSDLNSQDFFFCSCMLETAELTEVQNDGDLILLGPIKP